MALLMIRFINDFLGLFTRQLFDVVHMPESGLLVVLGGPFLQGGTDFDSQRIKVFPLFAIPLLLYPILFLSRRVPRNLRIQRPLQPILGALPALFACRLYQPLYKAFGIIGTEVTANGFLCGLADLDGGGIRIIIQGGCNGKFPRVGHAVEHFLIVRIRVFQGSYLLSLI